MFYCLLGCTFIVCAKLWLPPKCPLEGPAWRAVQAGRGSCTSGRVKPGRGASPRSRQRFALKLFLSNLCRLLRQSGSSWVHRWLDPGLLHGALPLSIPPSLPTLCLGDLIATAGLRGAGCLAREGSWVLQGLQGSQRSLRCLSVAFSGGLLSWAAGDSLEKAAGGWLGAVLGRGRLWAEFVPEIHSELCWQQWWLLRLTVCLQYSNQGNIFELTGLCSAVSK